jgi:hypothetical protein
VVAHAERAGVRCRVYPSGENLYLGVTGLPDLDEAVHVPRRRGKSPIKTFGPFAYRPDIYPGEQTVNLREGNQSLDETVARYEVEFVVETASGDTPRVFKGKLKT